MQTVPKLAGKLQNPQNERPIEQQPPLPAPPPLPPSSAQPHRPAPRTPSQPAILNFKPRIYRAVLSVRKRVVPPCAIFCAPSVPTSFRSHPWPWYWVLQLGFEKGCCLHSIYSCPMGRVDKDRPWQLTKQVLTTLFASYWYPALFDAYGSSLTTCLPPQFDVEFSTGPWRVFYYCSLKRRALSLVNYFKSENMLRLNFEEHLINTNKKYLKYYHN